jgi:integrase
LPSDIVVDTVTAAVRPADPLILALAFIHAARPGAIRALQLEDVDQANRRLTIGGHARPLDDLTMRALLNWLDYRRTRWPTTANPHLLVNVHSAMFFGPVSYQWLTSAFRGEHYAKLDQLRIDRTLDEALAYPGDPLHLAAMFGITDTTAIRYTESARQLLIAAVEGVET